MSDAYLTSVIRPEYEGELQGGHTMPSTSALKCKEGSLVYIEKGDSCD